MTPYALVNSQAGSVEDPGALCDHLRSRGWVVRRADASDGDASAFVEDAAAQGAECLVAVGGDGTVHRLVNVLMDAGAPLPLGVLPMGTGNDLARTLAVSSGLEAAIETVEAGRTAALDLFSLTSEAGSRYGINASAGGFSGVVDEALSEELKAQWGPLAYLVGAAKALAQLEAYPTRIGFDDETPETMEVLNVVIANGRTAAGGHAVAPEADPRDGLLDVVTVQRGPAAELVEVGARLMAGGNYLDSRLVTRRRVRSVRVDAGGHMRFNIDGELVARDPVQFQVHPGALRVIVGDDFGV